MAANESNWPEALAVNRELGPWCPMAYPLGSAGRDTSLLRKRVQIGAKRDTNLLREDTAAGGQREDFMMPFVYLHNRHYAKLPIVCFHSCATPIVVLWVPEAATSGNSCLSWPRKSGSAVRAVARL